jgi:hypothetical protein
MHELWAGQGLPGGLLLLLAWSRRETSCALSGALAPLQSWQGPLPTCGVWGLGLRIWTLTVWFAGSVSIKAGNSPDQWRLELMMCVIWDSGPNCNGSWLRVEGRGFMV